MPPSRLFCMSTRGVNFLHKWISNNVPETVGANVISVAELTQKLFADARSLGISSTEIEEDTGSVYETILDAVVQNAARQIVRRYGENSP